MYEGDFSREFSGKYIIEKVNLTRASLKKAAMFRNRIFNLLELKQIYIIIDMNQCEFMDSTFQGSLVMIYKKIKEQSGNLKLIVKSKNILEMFKQSGLIRFLEIYSSIEEALPVVSE